MRFAVLGFILSAAVNGQVERVVNAASFLSSDAIAPSSIISIFGRNLATATAQATDVASPPTTLGGVRVNAGGKDALLFYVSERQINARLDPATPPGASVTLTVQSAAGTFSTSIAISATAVPGIFASNGAGTRDAAVLNAVTFARPPFSVTTGGQPTYVALFATGLDLSKPPGVSIGGASVPVAFAGDAPCCKGLQQINVQLTPALAGAGRVEVAVTAGGKTSNVVEIVILPSKGQGPFAPDNDNEARSRELASLAWIPNTQLVLLTDENDDVVRVIDVKQKKVIQTIAIAADSSPAAVAVTNSNPAVAIVAERDAGKVALITGAGGVAPTVAEITTGKGPSAIAISGTTAGVVNQDDDSVSLIDVINRKVTATITVGRGPRGIAMDATRAYITNQIAGTISVIDLASKSVVTTWTLPSNARPQSIAVIAGLGGIITEPTAADARVYLLNLATGATTAVPDINPDRSGGSSDIAVYSTSNTIYLASQTGAKVIALKLTAAGSLQSNTAIAADIGPRALTIDGLDKLLVVANQGSGTIVLIDLNTNQVVDRVNGVRSEGEDDSKHDDHGDRDHAANVPMISSVTPASANAGTSNIAFTLAGTNLTGATSIVFINPADIPGNGHAGGNGNGHGPKVQSDATFTLSNLQVNSAATSVTATVSIASSAAKGARLVRVLTPNGESTLTLSNANTFTVK